MVEIPYTPGIFNWQWVRGTTTPVIFTFSKNGSPVEFDDVRLTVFRKRGRELAFRVSTLEGTMSVTNPATSEVTFTPTPEQTRGLTQSRLDQEALNTYEIEIRNNGSEQVYLMGSIKAIGGINDDEGDTP